MKKINSRNNMIAKTESPKDADLVAKTNQIKLRIECPKRYDQLVDLNTCEKCDYFAGNSGKEILCNYKPVGEKRIHPKNKLNELSGKEWLFFTKTVLRTSYPAEYGHKLRRKHHANKPPRLMKHLIEFFTSPGEVVLDPFAGVGGTLLGASICDKKRKAVGIEINRKWRDIYHKICEEKGIEKQKMIVGDTLKVLPKFIKEGKKFDAVITDPPYSPTLEKTLCDGKYGWARRKSPFTSFSNKSGDFRNVKSFDEYYEKMEIAGKLIFDVLKDGRYLAMMIRDSYQNGRFIPASSEVAKRLENIDGFVFKGIKIWYQTGAPIRPYGYPASYVPNMVHHNILIFKKET